MTSHLNGLGNAIKMLRLRISILSKYLEQVKAGKIKKDHSILRKIASLCNLLPATDTATFKSELFIEYNDALLLTYLSSLTKSADQIQELVQKFSVTFDRHHSSRRGHARMFA